DLLNAIQALYQLSYSPGFPGPGGWPRREGAEPSAAAGRDQAPFCRVLGPLAVVLVAFVRQAVDLVLGEVVVLVLHERHLVVLGLSEIVVLGEVDADVLVAAAAARLGVGALFFVLVAGDQRRLVGHLVQLGGLFGFGLEALFVSRLGLDLGLFDVVLGQHGA